MDKEELNRLRQRNTSLESKMEEILAELHQKNRLLKIETALEKVSSRTIAMRSSVELSETSSVLFHQLKELDIDAIRTSVGIFDDENEAMELWLTSVSDSQEVMKILDFVNLHIHPVYENLIPARQQKQSFALTVLSGDEVKQYYQMMSTYLSITRNKILHEREFFYSFFFSQGALNVNTTQALTEEECNIITQFAQVFGLIYMRFLDLQKAESQAREAFRKTALDRVQAEIASMRTVDDLNRITPLIWKELINLGVPFFRCGVFIIDVNEQFVHAYLSTPEGKSLGVLHLAFGSVETVSNMVENWRLQKLYTEQWNSQQFQDWVQSMYQQGQIKEIIQYQAGDSPLESLSLQFIPFAQGMLYVGSHEPLEESQLEIVKSLADSFSFAYARYEDFKQLEETKNRIEITLSELKAMQSQLIQSEKMASLGELTAGIAHEIQNPLNFVNNFSEVNRELIEELLEDLKTGKTDEAMIVTKNIHENEEKIISHGRRASDIVKGMLLHSRTSEAQKELTDINDLAAEYLKLAYHGLRAKDKSFNAGFKTSLDDSLHKISVIPQDIGRVLLNVINNAFYAVDKKAKQGSAGYQPEVMVSTKQIEGKVEIRIKDNGIGISEKIREKIFQPFFTTKPTGQGTGLGLSLSYDIISKGHGGTIDVESKEGEGTVFIIKLPINKTHNT